MASLTVPGPNPAAAGGPGTRPTDPAVCPAQEFDSRAPFPSALPPGRHTRAAAARGIPAGRPGLKGSGGPGANV